MKCGILIIGSLYWDDDNGRREWRRPHLDTFQNPVTAPIYYGRKSDLRGGTYTMTFRPSDPSGRAVLVPCQREIETIDDLKAETAALWKAEAPKALTDAIGSGWGCVGALLRTGKADEKLAPAWRDHFRQVRANGLSVINADGGLDITWPETTDGTPVDMDIISATATKPEAKPPGADFVADAWLDQDGGYERYFFENVRHGIRTAHDLEIWNYIEADSPTWLEAEGYREAVEILRDETEKSIASSSMLTFDMALLKGR